MLAVPQSVSDESIRKFARCHRQYRLPVITWRHPRSKALLLRASGFHSRGPMGMLRHNPGSGKSILHKVTPDYDFSLSEI